MKLADFGIARATGQSSITQVGSVLGTAAYLSPEQARGEEAGPQADLYSLGVVTYQLLSGRLPYEATSLSELALKQQREAPIPLQRLNPHVPAALAEAVALAISVVARGAPADGRGALGADRGRRQRHLALWSDDAPTRHIGMSTAATRVLPARDRDSRRRRRWSRTRAPRRPRRSPRTPRTVPARRPAAAASRPGAERSARPERERRSAARPSRRLCSRCCCVMRAVIVIVVAVALHQARGRRHVPAGRRTRRADARQQVQAIISKYTK